MHTERNPSSVSQRIEKLMRGLIAEGLSFIESLVVAQSIMRSSSVTRRRVVRSAAGDGNTTADICRQVQAVTSETFDILYSKAEPVAKSGEFSPIGRSRRRWLLKVRGVRRPRGGV
jgi:D-ribose pyranose/furanose isomerase RbsD